MRALRSMAPAALAALLLAMAPPALAANDDDDCVGSGKWPVGCTEFLADGHTIHHDEEWCCEHLGDEGGHQIGDFRVAPTPPRTPRFGVLAPAPPSANPGALKAR